MENKIMDQFLPGQIRPHGVGAVGGSNVPHCIKLWCKLSLSMKK